MSKEKDKNKKKINNLIFAIILFIIIGVITYFLAQI